MLETLGRATESSAIDVVCVQINDYVTIYKKQGPGGCQKASSWAYIIGKRPEKTHFSSLNSQCCS